MSVADRRGQVWDHGQHGVYLVIGAPVPYGHHDLLNIVGSPCSPRWYAHKCLRLDGEPGDVWSLMENVNEPLEHGDYQRIA